MKYSRVREMSMEVTVGAFMFMVVLLLGVFTIVLSRDALFTRTHYTEVDFPTVMGIREGDNVYVRGVVAGKVRRIDDETTHVTVTLGLDRELELKTDYRIEILPTSVLGGRYLSVFEGSPDAALLPKDTRIKGQLPVELIEEATRMVKQIRDALDEGQVLTNIKTAMKNVSEVTVKLNEGQGTIGKLINDDEVYRDLKELSSNLKTLSARLNAPDHSIAKLLDDKGKVYEDIAAITANLRKTSQELADGKGLLGKLLSEDDTVYDDLKASAAAIKDITTTMSAGEGTLGKLAKDDALYVELRLMINELRATLDDFRENSPITTFTSIFFGAF